MEASSDELTLAEAARQAGVSSSTLRSWGKRGVIPRYRGRWTHAAVAHARIVARLREQGHSLEEIKKAGEDGRLAFGYVEGIFPPRGDEVERGEAAAQTGLEVALIERIWRAMGFPTRVLDRLDQDDVDALQYVAGVLGAGFPLVALLQLARVYGQSARQIADAEARLFRMYVHEPLLREGVPGAQVSEEMDELVTQLLPLATPFMEYLHRRYLRHFVEQDAIAAMEAELDDPEGDVLGRPLVAIAFADLAGFVRFTEEAGEERALDLIERFVEAIEDTLPDDARVVKHIGDGVMIVGNDPAALTDWAIAFQKGFATESSPRIAIHHGRTVYRDGDYYGRNVNLAARVAARVQAGEVLVTDPVRRAIPDDPAVTFEPIGEVQLRGFAEPTSLYAAHATD